MCGGGSHAQVLAFIQDSGGVPVARTHSPQAKGPATAVICSRVVHASGRRRSVPRSAPTGWTPTGIVHFPSPEQDRKQVSATIFPELRPAR
ncbi:hypothetical protein BN2537_4681 [Streptomyces venezuelae]|nr:hypothetical protein BN2537_4681 [Streptomyces venezuelae]